MKKFWFGFYSYPPDTAGSGSGSPENIASPGTDSSVTSGSASESLIAAAMASESSSGGSTTETEAQKVAKATGINITGDTPKPGAQSGAAKPDATGQPVAEATGPVPADRHKVAVTNARAAGVAETEAKYSWAKNLDQDTVSTAFGIAHNVLKNTDEFLKVLAADQGYTLVKAGAAPAGAAAAPASGEFKLPEPKLHSEDGQGAFSSAQVGEILTNFTAHLESRFGERLQPLLTDREKAQKIAAQQQESAAVTQTVTETMTDLRARPFFQVEDKDGKKVDSPKIYEYLMAIPKAQRLANPVAALHRAYSTYMEKDILPNYGSISEQRVRDENAKKAAGSSGVRPGQATGTGEAKPIRGVSDLAAKMEQMYAAASSGA